MNSRGPGAIASALRWAASGLADAFTAVTDPSFPLTAVSTNAAFDLDLSTFASRPTAMFLRLRILP
jgi:hypothetical protein